ncbi:MAG: sigma-70 family RNA polymerase sigma factor [Deltaproteobacteria bacterium]|nr:sigma-70 family RNA polymerase sigma factor [Deltaproteobacteria bacterium]
MQSDSTGDPQTDEITRLLKSWSGGDPEVLDELMPMIYDRLCGLASSFLRYERSDHTLDTSSLIHEAYLRLVDQNQVQWRDRAHFFAIAGKMMRRILVDHSRRKGSEKRGGDLVKLQLEESMDSRVEPAISLLVLDGALHVLERTNEELARLVELRYFSGLTKVETAEVMGISTATVIRRWRLARAWLHTYLVKGTLLEI